ncbi:hypothetical protein [Acetivibrio cellulolyticus]|uniref:hypothetical protein n=1 Tax=Acetivibrio cellulolyticus TaxID=35830 RepID=UPI0001E2F606|nr:hypothetical protein [Acetivibrio cellulolyticus]
MKIKINIKKISKRNNLIQSITYDYPICPDTVDVLIEETVKLCIKDYEERQENSEIIKVLTMDDIEDSSLSGKVSFGRNYGDNKPDLEKAVTNAKQSFQDGIVVIFIDGVQMKNLEDNIVLCEDSEITFVKMTMLSGRMW